MWRIASSGATTSSGSHPQGAQEPQQSHYVATASTPTWRRGPPTSTPGRLHNRTTLHVLERSLEALNATKGRKSLILVSEGFIYDPNLQEFKRVAQAARRANPPSTS